MSNDIFYRLCEESAEAHIQSMDDYSKTGNSDSILLGIIQQETAQTMALYAILEMLHSIDMKLDKEKKSET
jgi:hypothetical protein